MNYFNNLNFSEIISQVNSLSRDTENKDLKISILRNITVDNYLPIIRYLLSKEKFNIEIEYGDFDLIVQEIMTPNSALRQFKPDIVLIFLDIRLISPRIYYRYVELSDGEINTEKESIMIFFQNIFDAIQINVKSKVIINLFDLPTYPAFDLAEIQNQKGQRSFVDSLNKSIVKLSNNYGDIYFVDLTIIKEKLGYDNYYDKRYWFIGNLPYSLNAIKEIAKEHLKIIKALYGKTKKCLVLDCDNTLWGGIIGEDGLDKIKIGTTYPGNMYLDFQKQCLNLYNKGVVLAINSKNNEVDVFDVLENHPDMLLRKEHFACIYANWKNKADNLKSIAADLNIGLDSIVFVDDSEFECNLVKEQINEITVINLPKEAYKYTDILANCGLFEKLQYTNEDKIRGKLYKVDIERKRHKTTFTNLDSYYKSLEMKVLIEPANDFLIPRVSQLTQRTNQFNLTTKRYSEDDIKQFMNSSEYEVLVLNLSDKFGDMGLVGVQILDKSGLNEIKIDSFMMSCRVIGRGVENLFLKSGIEKFLKKDKKIIGNYIPTKKNMLVENFYISNGFKRISSTNVGEFYQIESIHDLTTFVDNFIEIIIK